MSPPQSIAHYLITAKLGAGGMGEVWRATDTKLGREVAVKVLPESLAADRDRMARFKREALVLASLNHPNIAAIYGVEERALIMELVDGPTLAERIAEGPLAVVDAIRVAGQIADALDYAHRRGVVHRDLKPANIKLGDRVKVLDFGLAKAQNPSASDSTVTAATHAGAILGTASYMSPEQASGKPADARSDVFSFGVVLYEMLSGRRAFSEETPISTMAAVLYKEPSALRDLAPHIPADLDTIVSRCLAKAPAARFPTMDAVRQALHDLAHSVVRQSQAVSIAVLPFTNLSADKDNEYFSDGLAEEILNALGGVPGLRVIARSSAFAFKGRQEDVRSIGSALSVGHILEGSVRKAGNRIRVTAQLVEVRNASQIWSERYDRQLDDIFAIQDEIAQAIVSTLKVRLTNAGQPLVKRYTTNLEAHNLYLRGAFHLSRMTPGDQSKGRQYLESAVALEPSHAPAWVELVITYYSRAVQASAPPLGELPKALAAARSAVAADESLAEAHGALGFIRGCYEYDWSAAMISLRKGLALNPESSKVHFWYAALLLAVGSIEEALVEFEKARDTDPLSALVNMCLAFGYSQAGRYDLSIERSRQALEIVPNYFMAFASLGEAYSWQGKHDEALEWLEKARPQLAGDYWPTGSLGKAYVRAGRRNDAERLLAELQAKRLEGRYVAAEAIAAIATALENYNLAFEWLETAVTERDPQLTWQLKTDPALAPIWTDPRFRTILRRMNLSPL
jgi:eukaryotic-like serine/threonine-protein kinase